MPSSRLRTSLKLLAVLGVLYSVNHFYRGSISVIAPDLMRDLRLSSEAIGVLTGAFFLTFALFQIPIGMMLDRIGPRIIIPGLMIVAVIGTLIFAAAGGMTGLALGRALMGLGCAGGIGAMVVCSRWFAPQQFATLAAGLVTVGNFGNLMATTPLAASAEAIGWRSSFVGLAGISALVAAIGYLVIRDAPPGHAYHQRDAESLRAIVRGVGEVIRNPRLPAIFGIHLVSYSSMMTVLALWGGPYLFDVHELGAVPRGNVLLIMSASLMVGSLLFGPLDRYFDTRKGVTLAGGTASFGVLALLALLPDPALWQVTVLFALLGGLNGYAIVAFAHGRAIFPDRLVGRGLTFLTLGGMGGVAVMQMVTGFVVGAFARDDGYVAPEGYRLMFAFLAVSVAVALAFYSRTPDAKPSRDSLTQSF